MRLTVNGVPVRVVDRIEVVVEIAEEGDTLLNGVDIHVKGGPLTIEQGDNPRAAFCFRHDSPISFLANPLIPPAIDLWPGPHSNAFDFMPRSSAAVSTDALKKKGFTLIELLIVIMIVGLVSVLTIPVVVDALSERSVVNGATLLQAALVGARDRAIQTNAPAGIRLLPDPALPGALNRWVEISTPQPYSEGLVRIDAGTFPLPLPSPVLVLEQAVRDQDGLIAPPTSWFWTLRIGERVHVGTGEYTIVGPKVVDNQEGFVNVGPPESVSPLNRGQGPVDFLFLVNGRDDNGNGYADEPYDGIPPAPGIPRPIETEAWIGNLGQGLESSPYFVTRRPAPTGAAQAQSLPSGCVVDVTDRTRSRLPLNPDGSCDVLVSAAGQTIPSQVYSSPSSIPMDGSFYHLWLADRGDVGLPTKGTARLITLNGRTGKLSISDPAGSSNPQIEAQR